MDASSPFPTRIGRWHPVLWTVFGPLVCTVIAVGLNNHLFAGLDPLAYEKAMASTLILPLCVGTPIFFFFSLKLRELAVVNHRLRILAATDGLTACLNRNAFASQVDLRVSTDKRSGTQLIVDANKFKLINDRYGHQAGYRALELIAKPCARQCGRATLSVGLVARNSAFSCPTSPQY